MWRLSEEVARKIVRNVKSPEIGPFEINEQDPFTPKSLNSVGFLDPYAAIGTDFHYVLELPYAFINPNLPPLKVLDGYWLYRKQELLRPNEPFHVPRYLADPNIENANETLDVADCAIVLPSDVDKLTCRSIMSFEKLIEAEPLILDCLNKDLK